MPRWMEQGAAASRERGAETSCLSFENVSLTYPGTSAPAIERVSLQIACGEPVAIIGASGCGKSSMLLMGAGLVTPTGGRVLLGGVPAQTVRGAAALILQDLGLLPWKTVRANVELGMRLQGVGARERRQRAREALERMGLSGWADAYPSDLSGGMRQRVAVARSLALDALVLMMDEPFSALDALMREQLQDQMLELWRARGHAHVLVTHSIEEAVILGRRIVVMASSPGHVVQVIENPGMGERSYRASDEYFRMCTRVRAALEEAAFDGQTDG